MNTPTLNNDEECALEEELANEGAPTHLDNNYYNPNFDNVHQTVEDVDSEHQTQKAEKRPMQNAGAKGKKVSKKADRVNDMTVALNECTAMTWERFRGK